MSILTTSMPLVEQNNNDKEQTYMQKYYKKNKEKMLAKMSVKTQCQLCQRRVNLGFLKQHMQNSICNRNYAKLNMKDAVKELNKRIIELEELLAFKRSMN